MTGDEYSSKDSSRLITAVFRNQCLFFVLHSAELFERLFNHHEHLTLVSSIVHRRLPSVVCKFSNHLPFRRQWPLSIRNSTNINEQHNHLMIIIRFHNMMNEERWTNHRPSKHRYFARNRTMRRNWQRLRALHRFDAKDDLAALRFQINVPCLSIGSIHSAENTKQLVANLICSRSSPIAQDEK